MKLFGTTTSPFVRRVLIVAHELKLPVEMVNTATDEGQQTLRNHTPIRKVPIAVIDGRTLFDSRVIIDWLTTTRGWSPAIEKGPSRPLSSGTGRDDSPLRVTRGVDGENFRGDVRANTGENGIAPPTDIWRQHNLMNAIDSAVEAAISLFYLRRDGVAIDGSVFATRQLERVAAIVAWLASNVSLPGSFAPSQAGSSGPQALPTFGLAEISTIAALDWIEFRDVVPIKQMTGYHALDQIRQTWANRESVALTKPRL